MTRVRVAIIGNRWPKCEAVVPPVPWTSTRGRSSSPGVTESWQVTEAPSTLTVRVTVDAVSGMRLLLETDMWTMGTTPAM